MSTSLDRVFDPSALSAQRQVTDWVNIKEKLGTRVAGKFVGFWIVPARGKFRAQVGVALADFDNKSKVYGVNLPEYFGNVVAEYNVGDDCGFEFYNEKPSAEPGMSATKQLRDFNPDLIERKKRGEVITKSVPQVAEDEADSYHAELTQNANTSTSPSEDDGEPF